MTSWFYPSRIAWRALRRHPLRTGLTVLAMAVGVLAVVAVTLAGDSAQARIRTQLEAFGPTLLVATSPDGESGARPLTEDDVEALTAAGSRVLAAAPVLRTRAELVAHGRFEIAEVIGTSRPYLRMANWQVARGQLWSESTGGAPLAVCAIGETVRERLFGLRDPLGELIRIGSRDFTVTALLEAKGSDISGQDQDEVLFVPVRSFRSFVLEARGPPGAVDAIAAIAANPESVPQASAQIATILSERYGLRPDEDAPFDVTSQQHAAETLARTATLLTRLLTAVGAMSLIVGAIGVMNIMLVSVVERKREIAISMALGARERDVHFQFLVEAVLLSVGGGVAGVGGALLVALAARYLLPDWPVEIRAAAILVGLVTSAGIGVAFGYLPARRAARLDPAAVLAEG